MNNITNHLATKNAVSAKFRGHTKLNSKSVPRHPASAEREFARVTDECLKMANESLKKHLPAIIEAYKKRSNKDSRYDDISDIDGELSREFLEIMKELEQKMGSFAVEKLIRKIASSTQKSSLREWKRAVKNTLGIDLLDDYYSGEFYAEQMRKWIDENVSKIKSIHKTMLDDMRDTILQNYLKGTPIRELQREIQNKYNTSKSQARLLARDQVGSLNAQISERQQRDAGCEEYTWSSSGDSRVRECHKALDGKTFRWDDPPEMWYKTKKGIVKTGRRCHPGQDYCCRCVAIPKFNLDTISMPMSTGKSKNEQGSNK